MCEGVSKSHLYAGAVVIAIAAALLVILLPMSFSTLEFHQVPSMIGHYTVTMVTIGWLSLAYTWYFNLYINLPFIDIINIIPSYYQIFELYAGFEYIYPV